MQTKRKDEAEKGHMEAGPNAQHLLKWPPVNIKHPNNSNLSWKQLDQVSNLGETRCLTPSLVHTCDCRSPRPKDCGQLGMEPDHFAEAWNRLKLSKGVQGKYTANTMWPIVCGGQKKEHVIPYHTSFMSKVKQRSLKRWHLFIRKSVSTTWKIKLNLQFELTLSS